MSSSTEQAAIRVEGAGKFYPPRLSPARLLRYLWPKPLTPKPVDFWALRDVSFDLRRGEVLGVLGRNGSGKSTLLQLVAGLLVPSEGRIEVRGVTSALLELGAGFNPEFTGRENIFLSGAVYGFSRAQMEERFDDIAAFADIGPHLDQPVKTYSTGMFARLAFSVAIQVDPDILLVDEVLSVGDMGFQAQCFRRIEEMREQGATILFVSHDLNAVMSLCERAVLLDAGRLAAEGTPKQVVDEYIQLLGRHEAPSRSTRSGAPAAPARRAEIADVRLLNSRGEATVRPYSGEKCRLECRVVFHAEVERPVVSLQFKTLLGLVVFDVATLYTGKSLPPCRAGDELRVRLDVALNLAAGRYRIGAGVSDHVGSGMPVPLAGTEEAVIEVVGKQPAYGFAFMDHDLVIESAKGERLLGGRSP